MSLKRRRWVMGTGLLLAAATARPVAAQDYSKVSSAPPSHLPEATAPGTGVIVVPVAAGTATPATLAESLPADSSSWWENCKARWGRCSEGSSGHADRYVDPPLGTFLYAHGRTQVANGEAARMILYEYDFVPGSNRLNPRGQQQLARIAALLPSNFCPVVIERTKAGPEFDEARRQTVLEELMRGPFPVPVERVVIAEPLNAGLRGVEAEVIHLNMLLQTQTRGVLGSLGSNISFPSSSTGGGTSGAGGAPPTPR